MRVRISYFYHVRHLPKTCLPISTAVWDPKWYHEGKGQGHTFMDSRGVINGVRLPILAPLDVHGGEELCKQCDKTLANNSQCEFQIKYKKMLNGLNFHILVEQLRELCLMYKCTDVCLLVHEPDSIKCGERQPLIEWFKEQGNYRLKEFKIGDLE